MVRNHMNKKLDQLVSHSNGYEEFCLLGLQCVIFQKIEIFNRYSVTII
jgi:hypothetical protein